MSSQVVLNNDATKIDNGDFPFNNISNLDLSNLNCSETMGFLDSLPNFEIVTEVSNYSNLQSAEIDINMAFQSDCNTKGILVIKNIYLRPHSNNNDRRP